MVDIEVCEVSLLIISEIENLLKIVGKRLREFGKKLLPL